MRPSLIQWCSDIVSGEDVGPIESEFRQFAAQRMLEVAPEFTVSRYLSVSPYKDAGFRKKVAEIYLAAGLPK